MDDAAQRKTSSDFANYGPIYRYFVLLSQRHSFAYLLAGIALMGIAALGKVPQLGAISDQAFLAFLVVGIVLVAVSVLLVWRTLGSEKNAQTTVDPKIYGLVVTSPKPPARVTPQLPEGKDTSVFPVEGTLTKAIPKDWEVWLIFEGEISGERVFWPHRRIDYTDKNLRKWTIDAPVMNYKDGDKRILNFFVVGPDGQALMSAFRRINQQLAKPPEIPYVGIVRLTSDMLPLAEPLQVTLSKPISRA